MFVPSTQTEEGFLKPKKVLHQGSILSVLPCSSGQKSDPAVNVQTLDGKQLSAWAGFPSLSVSWFLSIYLPIIYLTHTLSVSKYFARDSLS